jgi:cytochrome c peroxidase
MFSEAFPEIVPAAPERVITATTMRRALAGYIRELVTPQAPLDAFLRGDQSALSQEQKAGLELFIGKAGCVRCHSGPTLSDFDLHVLGTLQVGLGRDTTPGDDLGWGEHGGRPYAFRTAPLRQVALTAPYFHAGSAETLDDVLAFKNAGVSAHESVSADDLDAAVHPLGLSSNELAQLEAFLHALTDTISVQGPLFRAPANVPSGLTIPK